MELLCIPDVCFVLLIRMSAHLPSAACRDEACVEEGGRDDEDNVQDKCCEYFRDSCCSTEENDYLTLL